MRSQSYSRLFSAVYLLFFFACIHSSSFSQTTNISGIVNSYYKVIEVIPAKAAMRVSNTGGIIPGRHVMIIQMKGAAINIPASNTDAAFGDTTSLNNAGNYEIGIICAVRDDTVFMVHELLNSYTVSGKVQLVQFAEYVSANVTDTLKAAAWDSTAGTGGVIALFMEDTISLNAPIYANAVGFKGGAFFLSSGTCSDLAPSAGYYYNPAPSSPPTPPTQSGAYKGEGIAALSLNQSGGRGAPANAGGGGNNHNNSGGGGANLGAGGRGGGNSNGSGSCRANANQKGEGGKALSNWGGRKIFLGGGGGAGHNNNNVFQFGGAGGGGIIFIHANTLIGNGNIISANGGKGGQSQADGAGGGGGGGTIIMDVDNYADSASVQAKGGDGGDSNDALNINNCRGGGGGGGGGAVYFKGPAGADSVNAGFGLAGLETSRDNASCAAPQPALPGTDGQVFFNYTYQRSSVLAAYCSVLLPVHLIAFEAKAASKKTLLNWKITNTETAEKFIVERMNPGGNWTGIIGLAAVNLKEDYTATDNNPVPGYNLYRLRIIEKNNGLSYSSIQRVFIDGQTNGFDIYPNPAHNKIIITGDFARATEMELTDISGKIILSSKIINKQTEIRLPALSNGIYLISINQAVRKLVIQQ